MQHLSIARSLRLALVALTVVLAVVAAVGVASLYRSRQHYEDTLLRSSQLSTAAANLGSAGVIEAEVLRDARGPAAAAARRQAESSYRNAAATAATLARGDPISARLVRAQIGAEALARRLAAAGQAQAALAPSGPIARARSLARALQARQGQRQQTARSTARSDSREAVAVVAIAGVLALLAALALITALVSSMRRPLDALVAATRGLAAGELDRRVQPSGPRELQDLGKAFNAMAEDLAAAQRHIEQQRRRLAVTIESLGDALLVTEPDSTTIATVNPRAAELVPDLGVGSTTDSEASPLPPLKAALGREETIEHHGRTLAVTAAHLGG